MPIGFPPLACTLVHSAAWTCLLCVTDCHEAEWQADFEAYGANTTIAMKLSMSFAVVCI